MGKLECCLGHITKACSECVHDEKNKVCPNYNPVSVKIFEVRDIQESVQDAYLNQTSQTPGVYVQA